MLADQQLHQLAAGRKTRRRTRDSGAGIQESRKSRSVYLSPSRSQLGRKGTKMSPNMRIVSIICCVAVVALNALSLFATTSQFHSYFSGASLVVALALLVA